MIDLIKHNPADPNQRSNYLLTSFASNFDDLSHDSVKQGIINGKEEIKSVNKTNRATGFLEKIFSYFLLSNPIVWIFILFFSIIDTLYILLLDQLITVGFSKRVLISSTNYPIFNFLFYVISSIIFFLIATSVGYFISSDSDGSGIPEMKTVLSGVPIYKYFSFNAFVGKSLGLFAALVGIILN